MGLRFRINLVISLVIVFFSAVTGAILVNDQKNSIREEIEAGTKITSQLLENLVSSAMAHNKIAQQSAVMVNFLKQVGRVRANEIRFYDLSENLLYESPPPLYKRGRWAPGWFSRLLDPRVGQYRLNLPIGSIVITPDPSRSILDSWDELRNFIWLALVFYFLLNISIFWLLGRWLRPMGSIVGGLLKMQKGDFGARLSSYSIPELTEISRTFNSLAQALQDSLGQKQRLALIAEQASDAIIIHDLEGKISFWNDAASRMFGYDFDEIVGKSALLITPSHLQPEIQQNLDCIKRRERITNLETQRSRKDGSLLEVSLSAAPLVDPSTDAVIGEICNLRDVTEYKKMVKAERELTENKRLTHLVQSRLEEERRVIARELHDELGQGVTAIKTIGTAIANRADTTSESKENAEAIVSVASTIYDGVHGIIRQLRPSGLDHLGLHDTLQDAIENWRKRYSNIKCKVDLGRDIDGLAEDVNITVYRLVQECLTNIVKHSEASSVEIGVLLVRGDNKTEEIQIRVSDNGKGLESWNELETLRLGVAGMRERVQGLGGTFNIQEGMGGGVTVLAKVPVKTDSKS